MRQWRKKAPVLWTGAYGLFLLTAFLLWVPSSGYKNIVDPKHTLFLISAGVFFAVLAVLLPGGQLPKRKKTLWAVTGAAAGLWVWLLLSSLLSPHQDLVWWGSSRNEGFWTYTVYIGIFISGAWLLEMGKFHTWGAAITALITLFLVIFQFTGHNPLSLYPGELTFHDRGLRYSGEYLGTIGNADLLSAVLTVLCLYLLGSYAVSGKNKDRWVCLAGGCAAWMGLLISEVASGFVGVLGCFALVLPLCIGKGLGIRRMGDIALALLVPLLIKLSLGYTYEKGVLTFFFQWTGLSWVLLCAAAIGGALTVVLRKIPEGKPFPKTGKGLAAGYIFAVLAVFFFLLFYGGENQTLQELHLLTRGDPPETMGSSRIAIWKDSLKLAKEKPLLGGGLDTYDRRSDLIFSRTLPSGKVRRVSVDAAHNEYLNLWVNCGIPALVLHGGLLLWLLIRGFWRADKKILPLLLPVLGYGIHAFFGISQSLATPLYWLFLGALAGKLYQKE